MEVKSDQQKLIQACLEEEPFAWQHFVDRFLPVVVKTIEQIEAQASRNWQPTDRQRLAIGVFDRLKRNQFQLLRERDAQLDFETWLVVATRRICLTNVDAGENPS